MDDLEKRLTDAEPMYLPLLVHFCRHLKEAQGSYFGAWTLSCWPLGFSSVSVPRMARGLGSGTGASREGLGFIGLQGLGFRSGWIRRSLNSGYDDDDDE